MNTTLALLGGIVGAALILGLYLVAGITLLALGILAGLVVLSYILANATSGSGFGEFMRGLLIGANAAGNGILGTLIWRLPLGEAAGLISGVILASVTFLAVFGPVSNSEFYQGVLGWLNWLLPMSWLVVGLGLAFFTLSLLGHAIGFWILRSSSFQVVGLKVAWKTGTFFTRGGWISNLNPIDTAFNMGSFAFVDHASGDWHQEHEAGHTLNLGAFGSVFHFVGAVDENITGGGANAYSERLAEGNNPATTQPNIIRMWV